MILEIMHELESVREGIQEKSPCNIFCRLKIVPSRLAKWSTQISNIFNDNFGYKKTESAMISLGAAFRRSVRSVTKLKILLALEGRGKYTGNGYHLRKKSYNTEVTQDIYLYFRDTTRA